MSEPIFHIEISPLCCEQQGARPGKGQQALDPDFAFTLCPKWGAMCHSDKGCVNSCDKCTGVPGLD